MKLLISNELTKEFSRLIEHCSEIYMLSAWATVGFPVYNNLLKNENKIKKCVFGLHFYQTHPDFIKAFLNNQNIKFIKNYEGVFHPKVYLFKKDKKEWECIIGSANFTKGAFHSNTEIAVHITSADTGNDFADKILSEIEKHWNAATRFNENDLEDYQELWGRCRPKISDISSKYKRNRKSKLVFDLVSLNWDEYYRKVTKEDRYHSTDGRLLLLSEVNKSFKTYGVLNQMPPEVRKALAGFSTVPINEEFPEWNWGWFGSMVGSGNFKHSINQNNNFISEALDAIPIDGKITKQHFEDFRKLFMKSFDYKNHLGVATRLLCVKRPDYFVGINNANRNAICEALDSKKTLKLDEYWEEVIEKILDSNWWKTPIPFNENEIPVFNARTAFLDAIYYEPVMK